MEAAAETRKGNGKTKRTAKARINPDKQEAVQQPKVVEDQIDELVTLHHKAASAQEALNDAIKATAEKAGYLASVVRKVVVARAGEKWEEKHREAAQQLELFDQVGE